MTDPKGRAEAFVGQLRDVLAERLRSATLFGSAARDEWLEGISDINVLVLVDDIDAPLLARTSSAARAAADHGVTPLLMETAEWRRAADVFTIELADMQDASVPLFGADPVARIEVQPSILRLQAEREMRGKLLHLHSAMLMTADDPARLGSIFVHALPSFTSYLRAVLRLAGDAVPVRARDVIEAGCRRAGADAAPLLRVLEARVGGGTLDLSLDDPIADDFNTAAERIAAHIDTIGR
jgi:hypothetical protein